MAITRQLIFGIDPYGREPYIQTFAFADVPDANEDSKAFTCGVVPHSRSSGVSLMQESVFLGTTSAVGKTFQAFRDTVAQDGSSTVTAMAVTQRLDPDARLDTGSDSTQAKRVTKKRFINVNFSGQSPLRSDVEISYCLDGDPLSGDPVVWRDFLADEGDTKLSFDGALGTFCHIKIVDESTTYNEVVFPPFCLEYISEGTEREGRTD